MKKYIILIFAALCLSMTGCSNGFAKREYNSIEKISKTEDRYAKEDSVFNPIEGGYSLIVSKFDGRETLWSDTLNQNQNIEISFSLRLSKGQAKVVHVDEEGNVTTIIECSPETTPAGFVTRKVSFKSGNNRLKVVGYDCEDMELKMLFTDYLMVGE